MGGRGDAPFLKHALNRSLRVSRSTERGQAAVHADGPRRRAGGKGTNVGLVGVGFAKRVRPLFRHWYAGVDRGAAFVQTQVTRPAIVVLEVDELRIGEKVVS